MGQKKQRINLRKYKCEVCGSIMPIQRKMAKDKEYYHTKNLYCIICRKQTAHTEQPDYVSDNVIWKVK